MHPNIHCSIIYSSQDMEVISMPIKRDMHKEDVADIYNRILLSHNKQQNNAICSNMEELETVILSEVSQRKTNIMISIICGIKKIIAGRRGEGVGEKKIN